MICVSNFSTAAIDLNIPSSQINDSLMFLANPEKIPPKGTKVYLILKPGDFVEAKRELFPDQEQQPAPQPTLQPTLQTVDQPKQESKPVESDTSNSGSNEKSDSAKEAKGPSSPPATDPTTTPPSEKPTSNNGWCRSPVWQKLNQPLKVQDRKKSQQVDKEVAIVIRVLLPDDQIELDPAWKFSLLVTRKNAGGARAAR